ncbi:hypothetical protein GCM10011371_20460 [Novosphingobium marinum]|uniref:Phosphate-selective porin OprO/OprP n=1 Tax=Novosphingobium marinum TaxID=1514948 RepID=A0A7Y9XZH9_9SPHN|nr:porin [Novosphingobium marinum]NYH96158.1 phosphate-selective porin OprO/OprP [Novosphingobium marinum]GGC32922.1 hypothetical protein GCM10011371_20460 [Novosphingobium marinum]
MSHYLHKASRPATFLFRSTGIVAISLGIGTPAYAQASDAEAIRAELAQMRAQMERMADRIEQLEGELGAAKAETARAAQTAASAQAIAEAAAAVPARPEKVEWKGAPKIATSDGWSFKPRGRLQFDAGFIDAFDSERVADGFANEVRRARLGVEGTMPGGFGYKFEVDFAGADAQITDGILTYKSGDVKLTAGQHNNFQGLDELTSSLSNSFMERAAFTDAFGFERRVGLSAQYEAGIVLVQGGLFTDNFEDLPNGNWGADGRVVVMPKFGNAQLHFGASVHYTDIAQDSDVNSVRYRQRPMVHFTGTRFVDTGALLALAETGYGLEAAAIAGPFHVASEASWQRTDRIADFADPTFFGAYVEAGYFLTRGDRRGYKPGVFDRVKPENPVGEGGIGAIQVNVRYDYLDLVDAGISGGTQNGYEISLIWTPTAWTRLMLDYGHIEYDGAVYPNPAGSRSYAVDAFGMRAQVDF